MKQFFNENSYRKAACYCLQSRYGSVDIVCQDLRPIHTKRVDVRRATRVDVRRATRVDVRRRA